MWIDIEHMFAPPWSRVDRMFIIGSGPARTSGPRLRGDGRRGRRLLRPRTLASLLLAASILLVAPSLISGRGPWRGETLLVKTGRARISYPFQPSAKQSSIAARDATITDHRPLGADVG